MKQGLKPAKLIDISGGHKSKIESSQNMSSPNSSTIHNYSRLGFTKAVYFFSINGKWLPVSNIAAIFCPFTRNINLNSHTVHLNILPLAWVLRTHVAYSVYLSKLPVLP